MAIQTIQCDSRPSDNGNALVHPISAPSRQAASTNPTAATGGSKAPANSPAFVITTCFSCDPLKELTLVMQSFPYSTKRITRTKQLKICPTAANAHRVV